MTILIFLLFVFAATQILIHPVMMQIFVLSKVQIQCLLPYTFEYWKFCFVFKNLWAYTAKEPTFQEFT